MIDERMQVYCHRMKRTTVCTPNETRFEFRSDRPWHPIQKLCFAVLRWIGAFHLEMMEYVTIYPSDADDVLKKAFELDRTVREMCGNNEPFKLFVGPDTHIAFARQANSIGSPVTIEGRIGVAGPHGAGYRVLGREVVLIPWMNGMVAVPSRYAA